MADSFADALRAVNSLKSEGVVEEYAIAGAMALLFWTEPVPTYDLDVLVFLPARPGALVSLDGIYAWARRNGFPTEAEHVVIAGVPTQFLPAPTTLADEAIRSAVDLQHEGVSVRVVRPEYLVASYLEPAARTPMDSSSEVPERPRPSPALLEQLRAGKTLLRERRTGLSLKEKVAQALILQRIQLPLLRGQRALRPWERPWEIVP